MDCTYFFATKADLPIIRDHQTKRYKKLREPFGIFRQDNAVYQPRAHDLKSMIAVHRISSSIKKGVDAESNTTYIGHDDPAIVRFLEGLWNRRR